MPKGNIKALGAHKTEHCDAKGKRLNTTTTGSDDPSG